MQAGTIPRIRPLTDLHTYTEEITSFVDNEKMPVVFTKHGHGKYVFMSMKEYNDLIARLDLYECLQEGLDDISAGRTMPFEVFMEHLRRDMLDENL